LSGKPSLYVLAGVNGAGKSSVGGAFLKQLNLPWYNPDSVARALVGEMGMSQAEANGMAWQEGMAQLEQAIQQKKRFAFETTLGGNTVRDKLRAACQTHSLRIWYCGLRSAELHIARVQLRVACGGHNIPQEKIIERWAKSRANLIALMPFLAELSVFDNSTSVKVGEPIPDPVRLLHCKDGRMLYPDTLTALAQTPAWAEAIVEQALELAAPDYKTVACLPQHSALSSVTTCTGERVSTSVK